MWSEQFLLDLLALRSPAGLSATFFFGLAIIFNIFSSP